MSDILWDQKKIQQLGSFIDYLIQTKKGRILEPLADYYIHKNSHKFPSEAWEMVLEEGLSESFLSDGQIKLSYICYLAFMVSKPKSKKKAGDGKSGVNNAPPVVKKTETLKKDVNIYSLINRMISYCIINRLKVFENEKKLTFTDFYLINMLRENFADILETDTKELIESILFALDLYRELLVARHESIEEFNLFMENSSLMLHAEGMNIGFLSRADRKDMYDILGRACGIPLEGTLSYGGRETFFIRIVLTLIFDCIKQKLTWDRIKQWVKNKFKFHNEEGFKALLSSPVTDLILFLTQRSVLEKMRRTV